MSRMSLDEDPTNTPNEPGTIVHAPAETDHVDTSELATVKDTGCDAPAASGTFAKARKTRGGSPVAAGNPRYICTTSAPATAPVFVSEKETVAFEDAETEPETERPVYPKDVYERPWPGGNGAAHENNSDGGVAAIKPPPTERPEGRRPLSVEPAVAEEETFRVCCREDTVHVHARVLPGVEGQAGVDDQSRSVPLAGPSPG